jgi:phage-related protein
MIREVIFYKHYFEEFFGKQPKKVQDKIVYVLRIIREIERIPENHLKHLTGTDGLYEARIKLGSDIYRVICFFDKGNLVVLLNGFQKKTQKTPKNEIKLATRLKEEYYESKGHKDT